jgi:hypothetical protein
MNLQFTTTTIELFFLILQVVGLASTLLQLAELTCLIADILKKTWKMNLKLQQLLLVFILYPPGSWADLHPAAADRTDLPASWYSQEDLGK